MKPSKSNKLSNKILDNPSERYCEIYKITCLTSNKSYVGQAVSHILNHKKYRPYGMNGRFRCHVSEAFSEKKNQCCYLNNALRKYGVDDFTVDLLTTCDIANADETEQQYIKKHGTLYPNGYNLNTGGNVFRHTNESRKRVSSGVLKYFKDKKFQRFMDLKKIDGNYEQYIKPLRKHGQQYGWYVYINRIKADFGGVHISLDKSWEMALEFITELDKRLAKHLDAGNSLESQTTTPTVETQQEEHG
jgi:hypothetical protein